MDIIEFNNEKFHIIRMYKQLTEEDIRRVRNNLMCDIVLRKENEFYFCNHIKVVEFQDVQMENINNNY